MINSFTIFGVTIHLYGLLIGIGMITAIKISEVVLKKQQFDGEVMWDVALRVVLFGLVGARLWHVATDWHLYAGNISAALYVWNGGMSILGGIIGGVIGLFTAKKYLQSKDVTVAVVADAIAVGLPFGQAIGRLGNWVNQELYGFPTSLPWKLYIAPEYRLPGYESVQYFHPLFAYEALALLLVGGILLCVTLNKKLKLGFGVISAGYISLYSLIRFFLEFLRIDKSTYANGFGVNQSMLLLIMSVSLGIMVINIRKQAANA